MTITATRFTGSATPRQVGSVILTGPEGVTWVGIAPPIVTGGQATPGPTEGRGFPR